MLEFFILFARTFDKPYVSHVSPKAATSCSALCKLTHTSRIVSCKLMKVCEPFTNNDIFKADQAISFTSYTVAHKIPRLSI